MKVEKPSVGHGDSIDPVRDEPIRKAYLRKRSTARRVARSRRLEPSAAGRLIAKERTDAASQVLGRLGALPASRIEGLLHERLLTARRRTRFVVETATAVELAEVERMVRSALAPESTLPSNASLVPTSKRRVDGIPTRVADAFSVRPLFPGATTAAPRAARHPLRAGADFVQFGRLGFDGKRSRAPDFGLERWFVLTLPVEVRIARRMAGVGDASLWEIAYQLRDRGGFRRVLPEIRYRKWETPSTPIGPAFPPPSGDDFGPPGTVVFSLGPTAAPPDPRLSDHAWNLRQIDVPTGTSGGAGIRVGVVDTGSLDHPELEGAWVDSAERFSVLDGSSDPEDPLDGPFPGHGVAVSSVLASRGGLTAAPPSGTALGTTPPPGEGPDGNHRVTGVAPACTVLPVRAIESVVAISNIDVAEGIWHCVTQEVDVISLSIGGYANPFLERVVSFAVFHDIIVVAAAGQIWPFVPAPALYPDCIAATGSTIDRTPWSDASTGVAIDIAAPAVNVWKADAVRDGEQVTMVVQNSTSGTSFAAPTVAGAAALWLAHHGRDALLERYRGGPKLAEVLRHLLAVTAAPGVSWDPRKNGPGILHVSDLLLAGLPAGGAVGGRDWSSYDESSEEDLLRAWLGNPDPDLLDRILQILFGADADDLRGAIDRFGGELLTAVAGVADAADNLRAAVEAAAEQAADAAGELAEEAAESIEEVVDEVADVVSDAFATAAGWFD